jgi:hypothetical protein
MDKEEWRAFVRWLDQSGVEELRTRRARLTEFRKDLTDRDFKSEVGRMIRLIEHELLTREGIAQRLKGRRSKDA